MADARFVGRTYEAPPFEVTEASIRAYMRATGDLRQEPELVAPPTYALVYGFDVYRQLCYLKVEERSYRKEFGVECIPLHRKER